MALVVEELADSDFEEWDVAVSSAASGAAYYTTGYLSALCKATNAGFRLLAVRDGSRILGGVGLYVHGDGSRRRVGGRHLLYYNGPFVCGPHGASSGAPPGEAESRRVLRAIAGELRTSDYREILLKPTHPLSDCRPFLQEGWIARPIFSYEVDLAGIDQCYASFHRNVRRQIRRSSEAGAEVRQCADIDTFYSLHELTCRQKGLPTYLGRKQFVRYFEDLSAAGIGRLYLAGPKSEPATCGFLVLTGKHTTAHALCAANDTASGDAGHSSFLRWSVFKELSSSGYLSIDLTDAHAATVAKYKSQLGGRLVLTCEVQTPQSATEHLRSAASLMRKAVKKSIRKIVQKGNDARG